MLNFDIIMKNLGPALFQTGFDITSMSIFMVILKNDLYCSFYLIFQYFLEAYIIFKFLELKLLIR